MINFTETDIEEIHVGRLKIKTEDLTVDDMPTQIMKDVFELCGRETAIKLLVYMQGNIIQVPARPWLNIQIQYIKEKYDYSAHSIKDIARTIGVSEKFVREVLKTKIKVKNVPVEGQRTLDDEFKRLAEERQDSASNQKAEEGESDDI